MSHLPSHLTRSRRRRLVTAGAGLGTIAAMLASGAVASAAPRPAVGATTTSQIKFVIHEPSIGSVSIASLGGAGTITSQAATGNDMIGFETSAGGFSMYAGATANTGQDLIEGTTTPGGTVTGTATLSSGTTMTASINGGPSVAIQNGNFSIPVPAAVGGGRVVTPSVHVSPGSVTAGGTVTVSGVAPSGAKPGREADADVPRIRIDRHGRGLPGGHHVSAQERHLLGHGPDRVQDQAEHLRRYRSGRQSLLAGPRPCASAADLGQVWHPAP